MSKLGEFSQNTSRSSAWLWAWEAKRSLQDFLSRRCSKDFLSLFLKHNPRLLEQVSTPGLFLDAVPEVALATRLHELGLLPEDARQKFIETVSNYAVEGEDMDALENENILKLFTDSEFENLRQRLRSELLPSLETVRWNWESNYPSDDEPEDYMHRFLASLDTLTKYFSDDETVSRLIDEETRRVNEWIAEHTLEEPQILPRRLGEIEAPDNPARGRSIFDDIDADEDSESD